VETVPIASTDDSEAAGSEAAWSHGRSVGSKNSAASGEAKEQDRRTTDGDGGARTVSVPLNGQEDDRLAAEAKPVLQKKKSILKHSISNGDMSTDQSPKQGSARKLQIGKSQEQLIPARVQDDREIRISYGNQDIKRTGTYATLGLGYLIDVQAHDTELARRSKLTVAGIFAEEEDRSLPELTDEYNVNEELASGGFATVYRITSKAPGGRQLASKKVTRAGVMGCKAVDIFRVEIRVTRDLDHPNLCWRIQMFQTTESLFLVTELCNGPSLFEWLCHKGTLPRKMVCRCFHGILSGLACLHENGIMHRDIKPENILLTNDPADASVNSLAHTVKIIDFAVARLFNQGDQIQTQVGTLAYVAPEILRGTYNEKVDMWALGCTIFLCVSGCLPMHSRFDEELCSLITEGRIAWYLVNWLDDDLLTLIKQCLEQDAEVRPAAADVATLPWLVKSANSNVGCCGFF